MAQGGTGPMRDFDVFKAEAAISKYEPLDRSDEPDGPRLTKAEISGFFAQQRAAFADRTPEQEQKSLDGFFSRQASIQQRNLDSSLQALKSNPAFASRSDADIKQLGEMRAQLMGSLDQRAAAPAEKAAMLEKFDAVYANPQALDKHKERETLDFSKQVPKTVEHEHTL